MPFGRVRQGGNHQIKVSCRSQKNRRSIENKKKTKDIFPTSIISYSNYNKDKKEYEQYDSVSTKPTDFYDVLTKEKLFKTDDVNTQTEDLVRGIGDNNPPSSIEEETTENITQDNFITKDNKSITNNLTTQNFLDDKLMDDLLVIRGGIEGYKKNMASDFPKMPDSTKAKMEIELQKKLFDKYKSRIL